MAANGAVLTVAEIVWPSRREKSTAADPQAQDETGGAICCWQALEQEGCLDMRELA